MKVKKPLLCGHPKRGGGTCQKPAGAGTEHKGVGKCHKHDRVRARTGRYHAIQHRQLRNILDEIDEVDTQVMDLEPDVKLLRAMIVKFVNEYEEFTEALMAWYEDPQSNMRPRRIVDVSDAAGLIESVSRIVRRMHDIQSNGAISLDTFRRVTEQMGLIVTRHVKDPIVLGEIEKEWLNLALDAKSAATTSDKEE